MGTFAISNIYSRYKQNGAKKNHIANFDKYNYIFVNL